MQVRIGITNAPREVVVDLDDESAVDDIRAAVDAGVAAESMVWLTDRKGRQTGFPAARLAYIQFGLAGDDQKIGFS